METAGILLAGGASRRFGSPKAFAVWNERYFYEWSLKALLSTCEEVVIVTRKELVERFPKNLIVTTDYEEFLGMGPLAGIYTGMKTLQATKYFVLPCDMPFIHGKVWDTLRNVNLGDVVAIHEKSHFQPLVSIWNKDLKNKLYFELKKNNKSVMRFLTKVDTKWVPISNSNNMFQNINKPNWM